MTRESRDIQYIILTAPPTWPYITHTISQTYLQTNKCGAIFSKFCGTLFHSSNTHLFASIFLAYEHCLDPGDLINSIKFQTAQSHKWFIFISHPNKI